MDDVPFTADVELVDQVIPGSIAAFYGDELSCAVLEELYPNLDFVARKSKDHIDSIHKHLQKGRKIILTEDPNLHLVWNYNAVYIKPIPHYLLCHSFWISSLPRGSEHRGNALGFMRSYEFLIRHPSDFELAKEAHLIPSPSRSGLQRQKFPIEELSYNDFAAFIRSFSNISDAEVSPRWHFGQLRLSRLHWAVRIFQPLAARQRGFLNRLFYEEQFWQTGQFLNEFAAPLLFIFAALSLILSAMQVVLAAYSDNEEKWRVFSEASTWFAVVVIIVVVAVFVGLALIGVSVWLWQFQYGYQSWRRSCAKQGSGRSVTVSN